MLFMIQKVRRTGMNSCRPFRPQLFLWVDSNLLSPFHAQDAGATPNIYNSSIGKPIKLGLDRERDALLYIPKSVANSPLRCFCFCTAPRKARICSGISIQRLRRQAWRSWRRTLAKPRGMRSEERREGKSVDLGG